MVDSVSFNSLCERRLTQLNKPSLTPSTDSIGEVFQQERTFLTNIFNDVMPMVTSALNPILSSNEINYSYASARLKSLARVNIYGIPYYVKLGLIYPKNADSWTEMWGRKCSKDTFNKLQHCGIVLNPASPEFGCSKIVFTVALNNGNLGQWEEIRVDNDHNSLWLARAEKDHPGHRDIDEQFISGEEVITHASRDAEKFTEKFSDRSYLSMQRYIAGIPNAV